MNKAVSAYELVFDVTRGCANFVTLQSFLKDTVSALTQSYAQEQAISSRLAECQMLRSKPPLYKH